MIGEPAKTAGLPILSVIEKRNLNNILIIVTRYFGGILLGTGGLLRAYTQSANDVIESCEIITKELGCDVKIEIEYNYFELFKHYCKQNKIKIINVEYLKNIEINLEMSLESFEKIITNKNNLGFKYQKMEKKRQKYTNKNIDIYAKTN